MAAALCGCAGDDAETAPIAESAESASDLRAPEPLSVPTPGGASPVELPGLHNVVAYADDVFSGSVPQGEEGFRTLKQMGVRTIISVDGAAPDLELARAQGMRYVHLPIGYDGMDEPRTLELARAIRDLPGPVYVHCHHGKHRSAGATGAALVTLGRLTNEQADALLRISGTSPKYAGLYACVAGAMPAGDAAIDAAGNEFPEVQTTSGLVQGMVEIDHVIEHLKAVEKAGWKPTPGHPDLVPAAEAGRLADLFRHLVDDEQVAGKPEEFTGWMKRNAGDAAALEEGIVNGVPPGQLTEQFRRIAATCNACHAKYRD